MNIGAFVAETLKQVRVGCGGYAVLPFKVKFDLAIGPTGEVASASDSPVKRRIVFELEVHLTP